MNTLQLDNSLFLIFSIFFLVIWIYTLFFYYYWTLKKRDSKQKKLLSQPHYAPFVTVLKIEFKKTEIQNFYFEQKLPFCQQKKISWKLFLTFFSNKYSARKMQLSFAKIIELSRKKAPISDLILHFKIGHFSQKYLLHFIKITNSNVIIMTFTNWIDG